MKSSYISPPNRLHYCTSEGWRPKTRRRTIASLWFAFIGQLVDDSIQVNDGYDSEYPLTLVPLRSILGLPCMEDPMTARIPLSPLREGREHSVPGARDYSRNRQPAGNGRRSRLCPPPEDPYGGSARRHHFSWFR